MPDFGGTYSTGSLSVTNGDTTVSIVGALMTTQAVQGDHLFINGLIALVDVVTDDETIELKKPWTGSTVADNTTTWVLNKVSVQRYDPAITQSKARDFLAFFEGVGTFYFVDGDEPDSGLGTDGQFALKVNEGPWQIWYKTGGVWELQGSPVGITNQGPWLAPTDYALGDWVSWQGSIWSSLQHPNLGHQPDLSPTYWRKELSGGDQFNIWNYDTDRPATGEQVLKGYPKGVTFYAGLTESFAKADVASTGTAVFSFKKNGVEFATLTFTASTTGVWACASDATFTLASDELTVVAPNPRDATLSGVAFNLVGFRNG